jgi:hypothetical protein
MEDDVYSINCKEIGWIFLEEIHLAQSTEPRAESWKHGYEAQVSINGRNILSS